MPMPDVENQNLMCNGLVTINEAASFFQISRAQVYNLLDRGVIPSVKLARSRRIPRLALEQVAVDHLIKSTVE